MVNGAIDPYHIPEYNNLADPFTKYLVYSVWARHMRFLLNTAEQVDGEAGGAVCWQIVGSH